MSWAWFFGRTDKQMARKSGYVNAKVRAHEVKATKTFRRTGKHLRSAERLRKWGI